MLTRIPYKACPWCSFKNLPEKPWRTYSAKTCPHYDAEIPEQMDWLRCEMCNHVFLSGWFSQQDTLRLIEVTAKRKQQIEPLDRMTSALRMVTKGSPCSVLACIREEDRASSIDLASRLLDTLGYQIGPIGTLLDVGGGDGAVACAALELGFLTTVIDANPQAAESLRLAFKNLEVRAEVQHALVGFDNDDDEDTVPALWSVPEADAVVLGDVLEHMPFPKTFLDRLLRRRVPRAVYIATPNRSAPKWMALERSRANPYMFEVEHLHCFSAEQIAWRMLTLGYKLEKTTTTRYLCGVGMLFKREGR